MNETNPAHLLSVMTNSTFLMDQETGQVVPLVELVLIGYRARYDIEANADNTTGKPVKVIDAHTSRVKVTRKSAQMLRDQLDLVIQHLEAMEGIAEPLNEAMAEARSNKQAEPQ
jgi:hypothetical protein